MAKVKTKTVNRTGKSLIKKALVVKSKKQSPVVTDPKDTKVIAAMNEEVKDKKNLAEKEAGGEVIVEKKEKAEKVKEDKRYDLTINAKDLLTAGSHLGHKVSKTHPKARKYIFAAKDGIEVLDLTKTIDCLDKATNYIFNAIRNGKKIVMLGTKRQARETVRRVAAEAGVPFITDRWLGGTITNWDQIRKNIKKYNEFKEGLEKGTFTGNTKKEILEISKEVKRLEKIVGGLKDLDRLFDILFVVDAGYEKTAVKEAQMRGVKTVGLVDSDSDPTRLNFPIPANDDSVKSINLVVEEIGKAIKAGK
jgi:small subunit ribosomal protein S2